MSWIDSLRISSLAAKYFDLWNYLHELLIASKLSRKYAAKNYKTGGVNGQTSNSLAIKDTYDDIEQHSTQNAHQNHGG